MVLDEIPVRNRGIVRQLNRLVFDQDMLVADWVLDQLPHVETFGRCAAVGVQGPSSDDLIAGVVYHGFTGCDIHISMASSSPRWAQPGVIAALLGNYPFLQLGVRRVTCVVPLPLKRVHKFLRHLGFVTEGHHQYGFDLDTAVTFGMVRENCRWLPLAERHQV